MTSTLENKTILLIISGGIAAYKALELIRLLRKDGAQVNGILTQGGAQFITPLSVASLAGTPCYTDLFSLKDEAEMGHIRLSREADVILVAPASANMIAKTAHGFADDLAAAVLLATDKPVLMAPAMNPMMWQNPATLANVTLLQERGIKIIGPESGEMACGETGQGRMSEPESILSALNEFMTHDAKTDHVTKNNKALSGVKALVTSGPTHEPLDPVRFIGNRSSGKQGHAIAAALAMQGAEVTLVSGPVQLPDPIGVKTVHVQTAQQMMDACQASLPADIAVCAAAVSDWRSDTKMTHKIKKRDNGTPPSIQLAENPDILATLSQHLQRPNLVVGFAAETEELIPYAREKLARKGCDWIVANNVGTDGATFGADDNHAFLLTGHEESDIIEFAHTSKKEIAEMLVAHIISALKRLKGLPSNEQAAE